MTTTNLPTTNEHGRPFDPASPYRVERALAARLNGATWQQIADTFAYRSARTAEAMVGRYVAYLNGARTPRGGRRNPVTLDRRFGVEVEFVGISRRAAAVALTAALGRPVELGNYHDQRAWNEWRIEYDGSVSSTRGGGEAVSPVLSGAAGMAELKIVMQALRQAGARVSVRTGMHVHIDATDLTGEQIARLFGAYVDRQAGMDALVSPSRRSSRYNHYCQAVGQSRKEATKDALKGNKNADLRHVIGRYHTVNVTSIGRTGTVEFRQHQGTLNGAKALAWIEMLLALTNAVIACQDESLPTALAEMIEALREHGLSAAAARSLTNRIGR